MAAGHLHGSVRRASGDLYHQHRCTQQVSWITNELSLCSTYEHGCEYKLETRKNCDQSLKCCLFQSTKEKRLRPEAGPAEALGVVPGFGSDDIVTVESGDWPVGANRPWRVAR